MYERQRRRSGQRPPEENRRRDAAVDLVRFETHSLTRSLHALRHDLLDIVRAGIRAADAGLLVSRALTSSSVATALDVDRVRLLAAGKAASAMADAALVALGPRVSGGVVVTPGNAATDASSSIDRSTRARVRWMAGTHPVPDEASEAAGRCALAETRSCTADETLLVLLSGGASSLMAVPAEGVSLDDKRRTTGLLLRAGADIQALNTVRKHLSAIKGGALAAACAARAITLAISDVVSNDLSVIASGPTVPDASTYADALDILRNFGGEPAFPAAVVRRFRCGAEGKVPDTPKPGDARLQRGEAAVIGSRHDAMRGAAAEAVRRGYAVRVLDAPVIGEARVAAGEHAAAVRAVMHSSAHPLCVISSGETTVHVTGDGRGGRNQEFALALAAPLAASGDGAGASVGTDGVDGPTDAAGGLVDSSTLTRAGAAGLDAQLFLQRNDAYAFFAALGDLIHTGPTGTNVGDLQVVLFR